jgi:hypothetical protein
MNGGGQDPVGRNMARQGGFKPTKIVEEGQKGCKAYAMRSGQPHDMHVYLR